MDGNMKGGLEDMKKLTFVTILLLCLVAGCSKQAPETQAAYSDSVALEQPAARQDSVPEADLMVEEGVNNLTEPVTGVPQPGDLRFIDYDSDGTMDHVQTISGNDGSRINASGDPTNTTENPGTIEQLDGPLPDSGEIRRIRWE